MNWDSRDPIPGFGDPGILDEALSVMIPRGHGVRMYLPWQAFNLLEPLVLLERTYGDMNINEPKSD